jgi:hypothetical protein
MIGFARSYPAVAASLPVAGADFTTSEKKPLLLSDLDASAPCCGPLYDLSSCCSTPSSFLAT